jgi:hypothetical protein
VFVCADRADVGQVVIAMHQLALVLHLDAVNMPLTHVALADVVAKELQGPVIA